MVYTGSETQAKKEEGPLGELFTGGEEEGKTFGTIEYEQLKEEACPAGTFPSKLQGSVVGHVSPVSEMIKAGTLTFPEKSVNKSWQWEGKGKVKEVKPALKLFGSVVTQVGLADVELESGEEWGATTS